MQLIFYVYVLILVFLLLAYYKGFAAITNDIGLIATKIISFLQGR